MSDIYLTDIILRHSSGSISHSSKRSHLYLGVRFDDGERKIISALSEHPGYVTTAAKSRVKASKQRWRALDNIDIPASSSSCTIVVFCHDAGNRTRKLGVIEVTRNQLLNFNAGQMNAVVLDRIGYNPSLEIMATIDVLPVRVPSSDTMTNINRQLNQAPPIAEASLTHYNAYKDALRREDCNEDCSKLYRTSRDLLALFKQTGDLVDLDKAISIQQEVSNLTPDDHAAKPPYLCYLSNLLQHRHEWRYEPSDVENGLLFARKSLDLLPDDHIDKAMYLATLGPALKRQFSLSGEPADLENALCVQQEALSLTPDGHVEMPGRITTLGAFLRKRFEHSGEPTDIMDAVSLAQRAVSLAPNSPICLINLGASLYSRFRYSGELADIENAISSAQRAVQWIINLPSTSPMAKRVCLRTLGLCLRGRFDLSRELPDFEDAVSCIRAARYLEDPEKSMRRQIECSHELEDLENAFSAIQIEGSDDLVDLEIAFSAIQV